MLGSINCQVIPTTFNDISFIDIFRNRYVGNIEIVRNEQLEKVYFKMPKMLLKMWNNTEIKQVKRSITYTVNRLQHTLIRSILT
jgi:hypothetical protein